jgi:DnaJ family protein B protein 12
MESNKDEALRCFAIAEKHFSADNLTAARKFCSKSISLFGTPQAERLLARINEADTKPSSPSENATASSSSAKSTSSADPGPSTTSSSATEEHPSAAGIKHRHQPQASTSAPNENGSAKKRDYTPEQHAVVKRVRACKVTEYYEILALKKDCDENDVKKAYRKVCMSIFFMLFINSSLPSAGTCTASR